MVRWLGILACALSLYAQEVHVQVLSSTDVRGRILPQQDRIGSRARRKAEGVVDPADAVRHIDHQFGGVCRVGDFDRHPAEVAIDECQRETLNLVGAILKEVELAGQMNGWVLSGHWISSLRRGHHAHRTG